MTKNRYIFCLPSSDMFLPGTAILLYSLKKNVSIFNKCDISIFYNNLSDKSKDILKTIESRVKFKRPHNQEFCKGANTIYGRDNNDCYLSFEVFRQFNYLRAVYMDADMLCIRDISDAIVTKYSFSACTREFRSVGEVIRKQYNNYIQNAFMVLGEHHLRGYDNLISYAKRNFLNDPLCDQSSQNRYMLRQKLYALPNFYNFQHWGGNPKQVNLWDKWKSEIKVIHYSGRRKPWGGDWSGIDKDRCCLRFPKLAEKSEAFKLWHKYYKECQDDLGLFND